MKQTAVEWLEMQLGSKIADANIRISAPKFFELINQAKEMEKEQIMDAYYDGKGNGMDISHPLSRTKEISAEQYYNETFKQEI